MKEKIVNFLNKHSAIKRFLRIFLSAFLVTGFTFVEQFGGFGVILIAFQKDISTGFNSLATIFILPLLTSCTIAGLAAVGKYLRDNYQDYKNRLLKLVSTIF